jgi:tetratricopeptide (TPR) repeat protein
MLTMMIAMMLAGAEAAPAAATPPDQTDRIITAIMAQVHAGQNEVALAALEPLAAEVNARRAKFKGAAYCAQSQADGLVILMRAAKNGQAAIVIPPSDCAVLFLRGYVLENLHRLPEAVAQLRALIDLEPDFPHVWVEYAAAQRQTGDLSAALASYRHAADLAAANKAYALDQAAALRGIGYVLTERNDLDGAEEAYRQSLALAPGHPIALNELNYIAGLRQTGTKTQSQTMESNIDPAKVPVNVHGQ